MTSEHICQYRDQMREMAGDIKDMTKEINTVIVKMEVLKAKVGMIAFMVCLVITPLMNLLINKLGY